MKEILLRNKHYREFSETLFPSNYWLNSGSARFKPVLVNGAFERMEISEMHSM